MFFFSFWLVSSLLITLVGTVAAWLSTPMDVVKTRLQSGMSQCSGIIVRFPVSLVDICFVSFSLWFPSYVFVVSTIDHFSCWHSNRIVRQSNMQRRVSEACLLALYHELSSFHLYLASR